MTHIHHGTHLHTSWHTYISHDTHTHTSWHTYTHFMPHIHIPHGTHIHTSWHTYIYFMAHIYMLHLFTNFTSISSTVRPMAGGGNKTGEHSQKINTTLQSMTTQLPARDMERKTGIQYPVISPTTWGGRIHHNFMAVLSPP